VDPSGDLLRQNAAQSGSMRGLMDWATAFDVAEARQEVIDGNKDLSQFPEQPQTKKGTPLEMPNVARQELIYCMNTSLS